MTSEIKTYKTKIFQTKQISDTENLKKESQKKTKQ